MKRSHYVLQSLCLLTSLLLSGTIPVHAADGEAAFSTESDSSQSPMSPVTTVNIYISTVGSDTINNGTLERPYRTLSKAQSIVRNTYKQRPPGGVTVWLRKGEYTLTGPLELLEKDSGTPGSPVIYRSYPGERATITTAKIIPAAAWKTLNPQAAARVHPRVSAGELRELDLEALHIKNIDGFPGGTTFVQEWGIPDLIVNGTRQPISQWPNPDQGVGGGLPGWATMNGSADAQSFYYGPGGHPTDGITINDTDTDGSMRSTRWAASMQQGHDLYLRGFWRTDFDPVMSKVERIDVKQNTIRLLDIPEGGMGSKWSPDAPGALFQETRFLSVTGSTYRGESDPYEKGIHIDYELGTVHNNVYAEPPSTVTAQVYRVGSGTEGWQAINLLDEIDTPGEWALDFHDRKLYYYPSGRIAEQDIIIADHSGPIIRMLNSSHIQLVDLTIEGGMDNGIEMEQTHHITLAGNTVRNVAGGGILDYHGHDNDIRSNDIYETGSFGISVGEAGDRMKLIPANTQIVNNHIYRIGNLIHLEGMIISESIGVRVTHNLLHDMPKHGIRYISNNDLLFEYNRIHHFSQTDGDSGAFYTAKDWSSYGNVLRYNHIDDSPFANGFYVDDGDSGDTYYNNVVSDVYKAFLFGGGHYNQAHSNLIINSYSIQIDDRGIERNYSPNSEQGLLLQKMKSMQEPWKSYGTLLAKTYGYNTHHLWPDVLDVKWKPQYPNGTRFFDNILVDTGMIAGPKKGVVMIAHNTRIQNIRLTDLEGFANSDSSVHPQTKNRAVLSVFPNINQVYSQIGLFKDSYRPVVR
ncbi:right-handed parallel beta-helix repeat-containing protein [Paenibacillus dauci]|uniref:right-handed parallel beta-helix repeat-containing protein n=1 Tax=Paenibacillus dauci TaxID=1567106 RepID=UPI0006192E5C|nr:right-handed parallel beta-helix repeat-containing protein [Paenibacillus dauci]